MRVAGDTPKKPRAIKAVQAINEEQGVLTSFQNNTKKLIPTKETYHHYLNLLTGYQEEKTTSQLNSLGKKFISWVQEQKHAPLYQTFWSVNGMTADTIDTLCKSEPEFKQLVSFGKQLIGEKVGEKLQDDMPTIRARAPIYIKEFKDHDIEMIEVRERVKKQLEKEEGLTPQQQQALFYSFMEPFLSGKREDADQRRPKIEDKCEVK
jgi:hypothetical protein